MATTPTSRARPLSAEDLDSLPDAGLYELVDGTVVERSLGAESSEIAARIIVLLGSFVAAGRLGHILGPDVGLRIFDDPRQLRRPDVAFLRAGRVPGGRMPRGQLTVAPDLIVEVVSPGDTAEGLDRKLRQYLAAGVGLIWVAYPETRTVTVMHRDGGAQMLPADGQLLGEDVLLGFSAPVAALFAEVDEDAVGPALA